MHRVGVLGIGMPGQAPSDSPWHSFIDELRRRGYEEGKNLTFEHRFARGDPDRLGALALELKAANVDVILSIAGTRGISAVKRVAPEIPAVMELTSDPVASGVVSSLARPGGNVTGNAIFGMELNVKRTQLLVEALGKPKRIALLRYRSDRAQPIAPSYEAALAVPVHEAGGRMHAVHVGGADELAEVFEQLARDRVDGVVIDHAPFFAPHSKLMASLLSKHRLPGIGEGRSLTDNGALLSYGVDWHALLRSAARYVDQILKGAKPGELPVEVASKYVFIVNMRTAKALGIKIPRALLVSATEVLE